MLKSTAARLFVAVLAALAAASLFVRPDHPHIQAETVAGFWAAFGFVAGLALIALGGLGLGPLTRFPEEDSNER